MLIGAEYKVIDTLHENKSVIIYRALRIVDNKSFILKCIKLSARNEEIIEEFINEKTTLATLNSKNIIKLITTISTASEYIHVLEDINGMSLYDIMKLKRLSILEILTIATTLIKTIEYIHEKGIIHTRINLHNIIYSEQTKRVQIIDFLGSFFKNSKLESAFLDNIVNDDILYISPEQTGLTEEKIDFRSDFYSFGMSLYYLFLGETPFLEKSKSRLIHKQIAITPLALEKIDSEIPLVISQIVEKLIQKQPNKRYQNISSIIYDLKKCRTLIASGDKINSFSIASKEPNHLEFSNHLFGRENELLILKKAIKSIKDEERVVITISGNSGVGKTRLIEEFFTYFDKGDIQILRGKFDKFKTSTPYLTFRQIVAQLYTMLMSKNYSHNQYKISGTSTQVLNEVFPELKNIFSSSDNSLLSAKESIANKLPFAVSEMFNIFATKSLPLIIFMDDLQWADDASILLIKKSIVSSRNKNLHFVGTYRDNEIESNRYAVDLVNFLGVKNSYSFFDIKLLPFKKSTLLKILQDLFSAKEKEVKSLSEIIYTKTDGNPFYVKEFTSYLIDNNEFNFSGGKWTYRISSIEKYSATVNITSIINDNFSKLSAKEQSYLQYLSILDNDFNQEMTFAMMDTFGYSNMFLENILEYGFIQKSSNKYKFSHDLIKQYVVNSIDSDLKRGLHFKIGHYLEGIYLDGKYMDITSVVNHLNNAYLENRFPIKLFKLNVKSLDEVVQSGSYSIALDKLKLIEDNFDLENLFKKSRTNTFWFYLLEVKTLYSNSFFDSAFIKIKELIKIAKGSNEKLQCFTLFKNICVTDGKNFEQVLEYGNELFKEFNIEVPKRGKRIENEIERLNNKIITHKLFDKPNDIINLPTLRKDKKKVIIELLVDYWETAYYKADLLLMKWAYLTIIDYSFRYGNCTSSTFGYVLYGAQLVSEKKYKKGYLFGSVALKLNSVQNDYNMFPKVHNFVANFINPYIKPLSSNVALYQKSLFQSRKNGDIVFGTWANFLMHFSDYLAGTSLNIIKERIIIESSFILESGDKKMISIFRVLVNSIERLQGNGENIEKDEKLAVAMWESEKFYPALAWYAIIKAQSCYLYASFDEGLEYLKKYVHTEDNEVIMFPKIRLHFLRALLLLAKDETLSNVENKRLSYDLNELKSYIQSSSRTFKFEKLLLQAEEEKYKKSTWVVAKLYDDAIEEAEKSNNSFFIALSGLCVSRFWTNIYYDDVSKFYFAKSIIALKQWGAYALAKHIKEHKNIKDENATNEHNDFSKVPSTHIETANSQSLLNSFNAISQSQDNNTLISTLMKIILENATASRMVLIFKEGSEFKIKAEYDFEEERIEFLDKQVEKSSLVPENVIMYAINTEQTVALSNPFENKKFEFDEYITNKRPASSLVIPVSIEGYISSVLYIENKQIITPLSADNIKVLKLLLTQATIVYKNTTLYEVLRGNEEKLNKAQHISHVGSWQFSPKNNSIIWSEETYRIYELEPFSIEIDYNWFLAHVHEDDVDYILKAVEDSLIEVSMYDITHRIITATGKEKIVHQRAEVLANGYMSGTIQDITQSKHDEEIISRLSQVVNQNPFSTIITDEMGIIEYINTKCETMTGYVEKELVGKKMSIFNSGTHSKVFYAGLWQTVSRDKTIWRGTIVNRMKDGKKIDCLSTIFPILDKSSQVINFVTIQEDVTEQNIKDKLFLMQTRQAQMGEMLSMIAHQWRQPLSIISSLINKERVDIEFGTLKTDNISNSFDSIERQVQHLSHTISDFKDFFKPDKKEVLTKNKTIVNKSLKLVEHSLKIKNINVEVNHRSGYEYKTFENEIVQVIINLLKNSQDAFLEHNITDKYIKITTDIKDESAIICVEDNAKGVDKSVIDTLFLPYISTKEKKNGTGLGLYMSKTIVEQHCKGSLSFVNTKDGVKFTIVIPFEGQR